jgi:hypothetical protein
MRSSARSFKDSIKALVAMISKFGQLFSSPKPKKAEAPNVTDISTQRLWKNFCLQSSLLEGRKKRGQSFTLP